MGFSYKSIDTKSPTMSAYSNNNVSFEVNNTKISPIEVESMDFNIESYDVTSNSNQSPAAISSLVGNDDTSFKSEAATACVVSTSILSGVVKIGEYVSDGTYFLNELPFYFGLKVKDFFMGTDDADKLMDNTLDFIRRDRTSELNQQFYENTEIGRKINEASTIKYDSEEAMSIRNTSESVAKFGAATALTVAFGGTAAPVIVGALYGSGKALETYSNKVDRENGESYNYTEAMFKAAAGGGTGAVEWWGMGQIGNMGLSGLKAIGSSGGKISLTGIKSAASNYLKESGGLKKLLGENFKNFSFGDYTKSLGKALLRKDNLLPNLATSTDHIVNWAFGDESGTEALKNIRNETLFNIAVESFGFFVKGSINDDELFAKPNFFDEYTNNLSMDDFCNYLKKTFINNENLSILEKRDYVLETLFSRVGDTDNCFKIIDDIIDSRSFDLCPEKLKKAFESLSLDDYVNWRVEYNSVLDKTWIKNDLPAYFKKFIPNFNEAEFLNYVDNNVKLYNQAEWLDSGRTIHTIGGFKPNENSINIYAIENLSELKRTIFHEFVHRYSQNGAISGLEFSEIIEDDSIFGFHIGDQIGTGWNEAITDTITNKYFGTKYVGNRWGGYHKLNQKLETVLDLTNSWGENKVSLEFIEGNYFSGTNNPIRSKFDAVMGEGFFNNYICKGLNNLYDNYTDEKLINEAIDLLIDKNGGLL